MEQTITAEQARQEWLLTNMGKGAEARSTIVAAIAREEDRRELERILAPCRWALIWVRTAPEAVEAVLQTDAPIVISDDSLTEGEWRQLWSQLAANVRPPMFILASRVADDGLWAELLNLGGYNLLSMPFYPEEVIRTVHGALLAWQTKQAINTPVCALCMSAA